MYFASICSPAMISLCKHLYMYLPSCVWAIPTCTYGLHYHEPIIKKILLHLYTQCNNRDVMATDSTSKSKKNQHIKLRDDACVQ